MFTLALELSKNLFSGNKGTSALVLSWVPQARRRVHPAHNIILASCLSKNIRFELRLHLTFGQKLDLIGWHDVDGFLWCLIWNGIVRFYSGIKPNWLRRFSYSDVSREQEKAGLQEQIMRIWQGSLVKREGRQWNSAHWYQGLSLSPAVFTGTF